MKLSSPRLPQQLLFTLLFLVLISGAAARAEEAIITLKTGASVTKQVLGVEGAALMVQEQAGRVGIPLSQIQEVRMAEPPEVKAALDAFKNRDWAKALLNSGAIAKRFKGLPASWAIAMTAMQGNVYLEEGDIAKAQGALEDFSRAYPGNTTADLGRARIAVAKNDFETARKTAEPLCDKALKEKNSTQADGQIYGQAFIVMGQVKEAKNDYPGALEDYLRTVTLFYQDPAAAATAQQKADALRKAHPVFVP